LNIAIEEGVGIRTPIVAAPAIGVERAYRLGVRGAGKPELKIADTCHRREPRGAQFAEEYLVSDERVATTLRR
jgi:hypothetical protein